MKSLLVDAADALQVADIGRVIFAARHRGSALKPVRFVSPFWNAGNNGAGCYFKKCLTALS